MKLQRLALALTMMNAILFVVGFVRPALTAPDAPVLRGRALELVDAMGTSRARINVEDSGEVVFRLHAQDGSIRVKMGASNDGSGFLLLDANHEPAVQALANIGGTLTLRDGAGQPRPAPR